jgi:hypothetical protein
MKVVFSIYAKQELDDATHYYEIEYQGLGKRFREEVRKAAKRIAEYPEAWSVERGEVRKCLLHMFPYKLHLRFFGEGFSQGFNESWKIVVHDLPKNIEINCVISMNEAVA